jgi:SAM-dependent methyltransferase
MTRFGSDPRAFFEWIYSDVAPWDIGAPQPGLVALLDDVPPSGAILDIGCGSGDLAIVLAQRGYRTTGIDFVESAIDQARKKAAALPPEVAGRLTFVVADALQPSALGERYGAVVDSGFYHLFERDVCARLADEVARSLVPGGRYYLTEFATEFDVPKTPRRISEEEVRSIFTRERGWIVRELRSAEFLSRIAPVPAIAACLERAHEG